MSNQGQSFQTEFQATRIVQIAKAPEHTAPPGKDRMPGYGGTFDWSHESMNDWELNPFRFSADDLTINEADTSEVVAQGAGHPLPVGVFSDGVPLLWSSVDVPVPEVAKKVINWATNVEIVDGYIYKFKPVAERRAVIFEMQGVALVYCPSVEIITGITQMGRQRLTRRAVRFRIYGTEAYDTGSVWVDFSPEES